MLIGLVLQVMAIGVVHAAVGGRWLHHIGAILLAVAVAGHGGVEVLQAVFPGGRRYRHLVTQEAIDDWVILVSFAILAYAVGYAAVVTRRAERVRAGYVEGIRLRWLIVLAAPLAAATFQGRGALQPVAPGQPPKTTESDVLAGLASQYLVLLVAVIGVVILVRHGARWTVPVAAGQIAVVSAVGARSAIVAVCVLTGFGAVLCGVRLPRRHIAVMAVLAALFAVTISAARDVAGRAPWLADSGGGERISALVTGLDHLADGDAGEAVVDDVVYRIDFNTFGALILDGLTQHHRPTTGATTIGNNLLLGVPSVLNPGKLATTVETRNEEAFLCAAFGLNQRIDWLPGFFGTVVAYWGAEGLLVIAMLFGMAMAAAQRFVTAAATPWRLVLAIGLTQCALLYEAGPSVYITHFRGVVVAALALLLLRFARRCLTSKPLQVNRAQGSAVRPSRYPTTLPRASRHIPSRRAHDQQPRSSVRAEVGGNRLSTDVQPSTALALRRERDDLAQPIGLARDGRHQSGQLETQVANAAERDGLRQSLIMSGIPPAFRPSR